MVKQLVHFLQEELSIPTESIMVAVRDNSDHPHPNHLPIILWQYGLITNEQLDLIFDWLETA